jgi:hypothetical protein
MKKYAILPQLQSIKLFMIEYDISPTSLFIANTLEDIMHLSENLLYNINEGITKENIIDTVAHNRNVETISNGIHDLLGNNPVSRKMLLRYIDILNKGVEEMLPMLVVYDLLDGIRYIRDCNTYKFKVEIDTSINHILNNNKNKGVIDEL